MWGFEKQDEVSWNLVTSNSAFKVGAIHPLAIFVVSFNGNLKAFVSMLPSEMSSSEILKLPADSTIFGYWCALVRGWGYKLRILYVCIEITCRPTQCVYILYLGTCVYWPWNDVPVLLCVCHCEILWFTRRLTDSIRIHSSSKEKEDIR